MRDGDTIAALSSGSLPSGVAIIRLSGPRTRELIVALMGHLPKPRSLTLATLTIDSEPIDQGLVAFFPAPHSFTGEDCAELQLHGSPAGVRAVLRGVTQWADVRLAQAGEFSRRAFENGKLDATEIEGLGDMLAAETEGQRRQALRRLTGQFSDQLDLWRERLLDARAEIEARLDFSDESDVDLEFPPGFDAQLAGLAGDLREVLETVTRGRIIREGVRIALAGPPNAGKSSLLNALAKSDLAIVTDEPGTTRDIREVAIDLGGQLVIIVDMAGLRTTDSLAEAEGVRRAQAEIAQADLVLWLVAPDIADIVRPEVGDTPVWNVHTKADLSDTAGAELAVSVATGFGIEMLSTRLTAFAQDLAGQGEPVMVSRERDRAGLEQAVVAIEDARLAMEMPELAAEHLRLASHALERLLGRMDVEAVLDRLFTGFCIGK